MEDHKVVEAELKAAWIAELGEHTMPTDSQWNRWRLDFGADSVLAAIKATACKRRRSSEPIEPLGLWKFTTTVAKRHSAEVGYVKPWHKKEWFEKPQTPRHASRFVSTPIVYTPRHATQFVAPAEWLDT